MAHGTSDRLIVTTEEAELRRRGYTLGSTLGEGSYAKVKAALADKENKRVAIKIINQRKAPRDFRERFLPRELDILQSIRHDNLVNMFEIFRMNGKVSTFGIMYSQFGVGHLLYLCCSSLVPLLYIFCPPVVPLMCSCSASRVPLVPLLFF